MSAHDERELQLLIASRFPLIAVETHEEARAMELLARCARQRNLPLKRWTVAAGLEGPNGAAYPGTHELATALRAVAADRRPGVVAWLDVHPFLSNPLHVRLIKEIAANYDSVPRTQVLLGHTAVVPPEIEKLTARFALSLPDAQAVLAIVKAEIGAWEQRHGGRPLQAARETFDLMLRHLSGLPEPDVRRLLRHVLQDDGLLDRDDMARLIRQKHTLLARDSVLSFEIDTGRFADVAGLRALKAWLERRRPAFLGEPGAAGLDAPKGIMLLGVQGCGKSLAAKAVAGAWGVPLMRLDFGALYNKFLGETERNLREALKAADAMAPCVLWIDEIEKGLAAGSGEGDGGVSRRVLGYLLTWMAERKSRVFLVATANQVNELPPELLRKGRFDEIFFVDLPDASTREEILRLHLQRRSLDPSGFDLPELSRVADGFSGAEIEQAIVAALYTANAERAPLDQGMLAHELRNTRPLSVLMAEPVAALRHWAKDRTVSAD